MTKKYYLVVGTRKMCETSNYYIESDGRDEALGFAGDGDPHEDPSPHTENYYDVKEITIDEWKEGNK